MNLSLPYLSCDPWKLYRLTSKNFIEQRPAAVKWQTCLTLTLNLNFSKISKIRKMPIIFLFLLISKKFKITIFETKFSTSWLLGQLISQTSSWCHLTVASEQNKAFQSSSFTRTHQFVLALKLLTFTCLDSNTTTPIVWPIDHTAKRLVKRSSSWNVCKNPGNLIRLQIY